MKKHNLRVHRVNKMKRRKGGSTRDIKACYTNYSGVGNALKIGSIVMIG